MPTMLRPIANEKNRPGYAFAIVLFLSGAAGVLFETLWFRMAGLAFGTSAWASAIVLAAFMAGLGTGNLLAPRFIGTRNPLRAYGTIELAVAATGLTLVIALPLVAPLFAPLFRGLGDHAILLNGARMAIAFVLLAIPSTLMGATLPAIVGALSQSHDDYSRTLGALYGWNTLGATAGALAGELALIKWFGIRGTAIFAADLDAVAAVIAFLLAKHFDAAAPVTRHRSAVTLWLFLAAATGFALLALEVLWFRFIALFIFSSSLAFAVMLAFVLLGIAIGAWIASRVRVDIAIAAAISAILVALTFRFFQPMQKIGPDYFVRRETFAVIAASLQLIFPVAMMSGMLFTRIGQRVREDSATSTHATSVLTFANTIGAALGSIVAAFVMIPFLGVERSMFAIVIVYGAVAMMSRRSLAAAAITLVAIVAFPFGSLRARFLPFAAREFLDANTRIEIVREGPVETAAFLRTDIDGRPYARRLFTNGFSMSATTFVCRRYMSAFAFLPLAFRPDARNALLISYGIGVTARALADAKQLQSIDAVDISRNILDLSEVAWPREENPLRDPRVHAHVEDGRFFLLTTDRRFDIITAEPPPPKNAGVVSLYSLEYFRLLRDRLTDRGVASYWLPVYQLSDSDTKAIIAAFCGAFDDCSLWSGAGREWMLMGSRGTAAFHPVITPSHERLGFTRPELLATTFLADSSALREFIGDARPLTDDRPLRLSTDLVREPPTLIVQTFAPSAQRTFSQSPFIARVMPEELRDRAIGFFPAQTAIDEILANEKEDAAMVGRVLEIAGRK